MPSLPDPYRWNDSLAGDFLWTKTNFGEAVPDVMTDVGVVLSHAAIVARELGIPAVVGTGDGDIRLQTGEKVRVDGLAGTVTKIPH